ncbi:MAG: hypothetical protein JNK64_24295 [Myxococcales bacterium]|nr:hypothetical protein [Myxococcales bacterium]
MPVGLFIKPAGPNALLRAFDDIAQSVGILKYAASFQSNIGNFSFDGIPGQWEGDRRLETWRKLGSLPYAQCTHADLTAQHGGNRLILRYQCKDGLRGSFDIEANVPPDERERLIEALQRHFPLTTYADAIDVHSDIDGSLQIRERSVADLQAHLSQLGELLADITKRETEARRASQKELEAAFLKKEEALAAKTERARFEFERQSAEREERLAAREAEHEKRVAEFETDEARRVRRKLLGDVEKVLKDLETSTTSPQTEARRRPIWLGILGLLLIFGTLAATGAVQYFRTLDTHYAWPFSAGMLGFSGMAIYGLRWTDSWHRQHAAQEMMARRYKADILRASWIAELASEWSDDGRQVPTGLVDVFARNLFLDVNGPTETQHPIEQLLAKAGRIEISKGRLVIDNAQGK